MREPRLVFAADVFQGVCVRTITFAMYEFVWGAIVLTKRMRNPFAMRGHVGTRMEVAHFFQDKESSCQAGLHGDVSRLFGVLEGTE